MQVIHIRERRTRMLLVMIRCASAQVISKKSILVDGVILEFTYEVVLEFPEQGEFISGPKHNQMYEVSLIESTIEA